MLIFKIMFNFEYGWCYAILCRQMLLPWQMLVPNDIVADVIALGDVIAIIIILYYGGRCYCHKEDVSSFCNNLADVVALWYLGRC